MSGPPVHPDPAATAWSEPCRRIAGHRVFQSSVMVLIVLASLFAGLETYPSIMDRFGTLLRTIDRIVIGLFTIEIIIRLAAYGRRPWRFFSDGWNVFDFTIVVVCLIPIGAEHAAAARLIRLLRVFRLFSGIPRLRLVVAAMVKAVPSIFYVGLLLFLLFYVYGILGTTMFARNDPVHFGDLHTSMLSLLRTVTLEDWTDLMYTQIYGSDVYGYGAAAAKLSEGQRAMWEPHARPILGVLYFVSFVLIGTMVVLNLFIGVVISSLTDAQTEQAREALRKTRGQVDLDDKLRSLESDLVTLRERVRDLRAHADVAPHQEETG